MPWSTFIGCSTDTVMHGTKIAIRKWVFVIFRDVRLEERGLGSREIERKYDLTPRSAWFIGAPYPRSDAVRRSRWPCSPAGLSQTKHGSVANPPTGTDSREPGRLSGTHRQ